MAEVPDPVRGPGEVLVDVAATAVNRADLLQRQGYYPPPPGASAVPAWSAPADQRGGRGRDGWTVGDEVCALLSGGGYAERVAVPAGQLLPGPAGVELVTAAGLPEVTCTVWSNVFMLAGLRRGETSSSTAAPAASAPWRSSWRARAGARVVSTAGTAAKLGAAASSAPR